MAYRIERNGFAVSDDRAGIDFDLVHGFLKHAYWSRGVPREIVECAMDGSLCFGLYGPDGGQVGFGRSITDAATFAYLSDIFVVEAMRGRGAGPVFAGGDDCPPCASGFASYAACDR